MNVRSTHPMALQHQLPSGEAPGWQTKRWFQLDITHGNNWSEPTLYTDTRNNNQLIWDSDFEQTTLWLEYGQTLNEQLAVAIEAPYSFRQGGSDTDVFIDGFHHIFGFSRFGRDRHAYGRVTNTVTSINTATNDRDIRSSKDSGIGNVKIKLKYWPLKFSQDTGLGFSLHIKVPVDQRAQGMTSGYVDYSGLVHFALPIKEKSAIYLTSGLTYVSQNWMFEKWPRNKVIWLIDSHINYAFSEKWAAVFNFSLQGPFMKRKDLAYEHNIATKPGTSDVVEKPASNYNALVHNRGQQIFGIKRHFGKNHDWMFYFQEDWGLGNKNKNNDKVYSSNQPDVAIGIKFNWRYDSF